MGGSTKIKRKRKREKERCVRCGEETKYFKDEHIASRKGYVGGAGQLCDECYKEIY